MWLYGSQLSRTSSGSGATRAMTARALLSRLPCVSITPLGFPVVPDVYMIVASDSPSSAASRFAISWV